jgi:DNA uptake protein ComE-like DNA-binding protein
MNNRINNRNSGLVLVLILWVIVISTILMVGLTQRIKLDQQINSAQADQITARWLARSGVYQAVSLLRMDHNSTDSESDSWYNNGELFNKVSLPGGDFTVLADRFQQDSSPVYGVVDENSKLNLNTATAEALVALPGMTRVYADAIIDWRSRYAKPTPVSDGSTNPATTGNSPVAMTGRFETLRQLAQIPELPQNLVWGEDANFNGILENNENDGDDLPPPDNQNGILDRGILAYLTVYSYEWNRDGAGQPRININTTSQSVLEAELGLPTENSLWIVQNRKTPFRTIADILAETNPESPPAQAPAANPPAGKSQPTKLQPRPLDLATFRRVADRLTISNQTVIPGRININTADSAVLQTLPGITQPLAQQIVTRRRNLPEGFHTIAEVLTIPDVTVPIFKKFASFITVRSTVFTIHSFGCCRRSDIRYAVEAVVDRSDTDVIVLYWKENR